MLISSVVHVLPERARARFDRWVLDRRWRRGVPMQVSSEVADRLWADGYRFAWRVSDDLVIGHRLDGARVTVPVERFVRRYLVSALDTQ